MITESVWMIALTGIGATLCMDGWALLLKYGFGIASLNYALPGRWLLWMLKGKFLHRTIITTPALAGERFTGWVFHYVTGAIFAFIPLLLAGSQWIAAPALTTAIMAGLISLAAPFFIMQPALGFGVAASRTPQPKRARRMSLLTHLVYGVGLYFSAVAAAALRF